MKVVAQDAREALRGLVRQRRYAPIHTRLRAIGWAMDGKTGEWIGEQLGYHHVTVRRWVARYNAAGIVGLWDQPRSGQPTKLAREQEAAFRARLEAGPQPGDGVSVLHGEDIRRILEREFGAVYSLDSVYVLLRRLGYAPLRPRPVHPKSDPEANAQWMAQAPLLSSR